MSISREQVADLQPGDVVELRHRLFPEITLRGPISASGARGYDLVLPPVWIRSRDGEPGEDLEIWGTLTVVSRAPRPLYVNHPRTASVPGDVVRDAGSDGSDVWIFAPLSDDPDHWRGPTKAAWITTRRDGPDGGISRARSNLPARLRLLVDGETGDTVPAVQS